MGTLRKQRGRPPSWPNHVTAPEAALELYRLIAKLSRTPQVFAECHIYHGSKVSGDPVVRWQTNVTKLPHVIATYMNLPQGERRCKTEGCCNPFHYLPSDTGGSLLVTGDEKQAPEIPREVDAMADWVDLVDWTLDSRGLRVADVSFEQVRSLISPEDLTDIQLEAALKTMKEKSSE